LSQNARELVSDIGVGRKSSDGYKPASVPNALKVINGQFKNSLEVEEMTSTSSATVTNELTKSLAHLTYSALYASNLQASTKWYYNAFGIQIVSMNPVFATMEFAPGRIVFFGTNPERPRKIRFSTRNMEALRKQLSLANVEIDVDEDSYLRIKDIDENTIEVWKTVSDIDITIPSDFVRNLIRCRLETRDEMHLIAKQIANDINFHEASAELHSLCEYHKLNTKGEVFIASRYSGKVDAVFVCAEVPEAAVGQLGDDMEYIHIPYHDYVVFPTSYVHLDKLRTEEQYGSRANFMNESFTKPEESYYILEYYKDDFVDVYMPYYWDKGWQALDKAVNSNEEVNQVE